VGREELEDLLYGRTRLERVHRPHSEVQGAAVGRDLNGRDGQAIEDESALVHAPLNDAFSADQESSVRILRCRKKPDVDLGVAVVLVAPDENDLAVRSHERGAVLGDCRLRRQREQLRRRDRKGDEDSTESMHSAGIVADAQR